MAKQNNKDEHEFLPAALEIQETPPSPTGRLISGCIALLFTIAVVWAFVGKVDIVTTAQGKIIPSDRTKVIQPLEIGTVRSILVKEGQAVSKGDVLIELDATNADADHESVDKELLNAQLEQVRAASLISASEAGMKQSIAPRWPEAASVEVIATYQKLLNSQLYEQRSRLGSLDNDIQGKQAELSATQAVVDKLDATLPLITERVDSLKELLAEELVARDTFIEVEVSRIETQQDLLSSREQLKGIRAAIRQIKFQREAAEAEFMNAALAQLTEAKRRVAGLEQELIKASQRSRLQQLTAPVSGVVQQLAVHTVGGVVTPAQALMVVVPQEHNIEVEAMIANKDIGFVFAGQAAEIKIEAFPFTKYGLIDAQLSSVSMDAIADEKLGLIYTARVLLKDNVIQVGSKLVNLSPGMAVTVEIKTGKRRLIEYIFSPMMRYVDESVRER